MVRLVSGLLSLAVVLAVGCSSGNTPKKDGESANNEPLGQRLFKQNCSSCHGDGGKGDGKLSGTFTPPVADLTKGPFKQPHTADNVRKIIVDGIPPRMTATRNLSKEELDELVTFVLSLYKEGAGEKKDADVKPDK